MAGIVSEIDTLNKEIEKTNQALSELYLQLGKVGSTYHKAIAYHPSDDRFEELCRAFDAHDQALDELNQFNSTKHQVDSTGNEITKTTASIKEIEDQKNSLLASLGAIACELQANGQLPSALSGALSSVNDFQDKIESLVKKRDQLPPSAPSFVVSMFENRIEKCRNNLNSVYLAAGKQLLGNPAVDEIQSPRVKGILAKLKELNNKHTSFNKILSFREKALSLASSSLKNKLDGSSALVEAERSLAADLDECYTRYGSSIASGMDLWLDPHAPQELKSLCERIKVEQHRLDVQQLNMDYLLAQRDIQMNFGQIQQYETQLKYLKEQRTALDNQINGIQAKIDKYNSELELLRRRQQDIATKASK